MYTITIYRTQSDIIFVSAYNDKSSEMFLIELPKVKAMQVLETFNHNYDNLVEYLDI